MEYEGLREGDLLAISISCFFFKLREEVNTTGWKTKLFWSTDKVQKQIQAFGCLTLLCVIIELNWIAWYKQQVSVCQQVKNKCTELRGLLQVWLKPGWLQWVFWECTALAKSALISCSCSAALAWPSCHFSISCMAHCANRNLAACCLTVLILAMWRAVPEQHEQQPQDRNNCPQVAPGPAPTAPTAPRARAELQSSCTGAVWQCSSPAWGYEVYGAQGSRVLFAAFWSFPSALGQMRATGLSDEEFGTTSVLKKGGEGLWDGRPVCCSSGEHC